MSVTSETHDHVTTITINRPGARNAVDPATATALSEAFRAFAANDDAHVAVLYGAGGSFCAGADLKAVAAGDLLRLEPDGDGPLGPSRMALPKPVIAAIAGYAVAGGLELALWCDLRVMEEDATLGFFERRWGVPLIDGGTIRLPRLIGLSRALDLILTGRPVDATEAERIGLANRIAPSGQSLQVAQELATQIAAFPQVCMRHDRMSAYEQHDLSLEDALRQEFAHGQHALSEETIKGATRFAEGEGRHGVFSK